jgi:hypothetical protein
MPAILPDDAYDLRLAPQLSEDRRPHEPDVEVHLGASC